MKTTQELKNQGTYKPYRHDQRVAAEPPDGVPQPPRHLTRTEKKIFSEIAGKMVETDSISSLDVYALECYSVQLALFRKAKKELEKKDEYITVHTNKGGGSNLVPSPWLTVLKQTTDALLKLTAKLGLSPVDRNKVSKTEINLNDSNSLIKDPLFK